jgi:hypothetical protein
MKTPITFLLSLTFLFPLSGCGINANYKVLRTSISEHQKLSNQIELGDTKEKVLSILEPIQEPLKQYPYFIKPPEKYIKDDVLVEILFMNAGELSKGGIKTDDKFIPYVFNDGKLVGIGWAILGGARSITQPVPRTNVIVVPSSPPPPPPQPITPYIPFRY